MVENAKDPKIVRQLSGIAQAQTADAVARVVNSELPKGLHGEAYLRGLSKHAELRERPRILDQAWGKKGRR